MQRIFVLALLFPFISFTCAHGADKKAKIVQPPELSDHDRALHALERLTFGPRPGDLERVLSVGVSQWIDQQLNPASISNSLLDSRLSGYRSLRMQPRELAQAFPTGQMIREAAEKKRPFPSDPVQYGLWEVLVDKYDEQQKANTAAAQPVATPDEATQKASAQAGQDTARHLADMLLSLPMANRMPALMKLPISDRRILLQYVPGDMRDKLLADFSPIERETWFAMNGPTGVVVSELQ